MAENLPVDLQIEGLHNAVEVGVGGFATVYRADQPAFRRTVAVKVLATRNLDQAARERFERECQAMGSLSEHPNIVTVYGAGFAASGSPYLVMAYLPGGSLQERLDRQGVLPWQDASLYGVHLAGALETAHRAGIVHRDIKPGNILMSSYGEAQLTDFGIARISGGHETSGGVITASMSHVPPEVLDGARPTVAADVYSLGSTIFELLAGQAAFASDADESMVPMLRRILTEPPPDLRHRGVPDSVCRAIERSLAKDPAHRQQSALEFGRELQEARRSHGLDPGRLTVPGEFEPGPAAAAPPSGRRSSAVPIAAAVAVVVLAAVVGVLVVWNSRSGTDVVSTPTTITATSVDRPPTTEGFYSASIESAFVDRCVQTQGNTRTFCLCIFTEIKEQVKYSDFLAIDRSLDEGADIKKTPIQPIIADCQRRNPGSPGTTP